MTHTIKASVHIRSFSKETTDRPQSSLQLEVKLVSLLSPHGNCPRGNSVATCEGVSLAEGNFHSWEPATNPCYCLPSVTRMSITALQGALDCTFQYLPQLPTHCKLKKTIRLRIARVEYNQNTPYLYICLNVTKKSLIAKIFMSHYYRDINIFLPHLTHILLSGVNNLDRACLCCFVHKTVQKLQLILLNIFPRLALNLPPCSPNPLNSWDCRPVPPSLQRTLDID